MSEAKLYAVKNDEGKYWDFSDNDIFWSLSATRCPTIREKNLATFIANYHGGHVVTFIEEPEKVVLSKYQAEIVENARHEKYPANYIAVNTGLGAGYEENMLIEAYVNGYTVAKDKRYLVELDGLVTTDGAKQYLTKKNGKWFACRRMPGMHQDFTDEEINTAPEWAQQLNRQEVTDDEQ